jgi:hypothetical protein
MKTKQSGNSEVTLSGRVESEGTKLVRLTAHQTADPDKSAHCAADPFLNLHLHELL